MGAESLHMDTSSPSSGVSTSEVSIDVTEDHSVLNMTPRPSLDHSLKLMKEIVSLEEEIMHLERYLLSLYRTAYLPASSEDRIIGNSPRLLFDEPFDKLRSEIRKSGKVLHVEKSFSSPKKLSPLIGSTEMVKEKKCVFTRRLSLAHHLGNGNPNALICPDRLSEDIIRCIASIYCKLADQTKNQNSFSVSSSFNSMGAFSDRSFQCIFKTAEAFSSRSIKGENPPYASMLEVLDISLDRESYTYATKMLQKFRSLVKTLEIVNPNKMSHEEKLAFWINIHNALLMHGYLAYGTHIYTRSNSIMKASYNVGGVCINVCDIQSCILRIKAHSSVQWLHTLLSPGKKLRTCKPEHPYAIEYPEPPVHFALWSGVITDPAVRVYSAKTIFADLKLAKEEFIQSTMYVKDQKKLYLPRILHLYARDMSQTMAELVDVVNGSLTTAQQKSIRRLMKCGKLEKCIQWIRQSSSFGYFIHQGLSQSL